MRIRLVLLLSCFVLALFSAVRAEDPIDIGSRLEPLVDRALIDSLEGSVQFKLHHPTPQEVAITFDQPWEGSASGYPTIIKDENIYRLYYRGHDYIIDSKPLRGAHPETVCYAESSDGIHWTKPNLGLFKWEGSDDNNIIWMGTPETHNFAPFIDTHPNCPPEQRYKAVGGTVTSKGLWTFQSADGIHWKRLSEGPVVTKGAFDSHNTAFWDAKRERYSMYVRFFSKQKFQGLRSIAFSHSEDFKTWSEPVALDYPDSPPQQMYTNQILPYYRAPHILFGFPTRYVAKPLTKHVQQLPPVELRTTLIEVNQRVGTDLSDGVFMSSRDGLSFQRWNEAFLRPGPELEGRWIYGDNYQSYGLYETKSANSKASNVISMLFDEGAWRENACRLRRFSIRLDGFVSLNALYAGGRLTTKPLVFSGSQLTVNYATSAAGTLKVALQNADGSPIAGYSLDDSEELFGDSTSQVISWKHGSEVSKLAGKPIRLLLELKDGDLYSFRFSEPDQP